jgi:excisionase family DNA binding protein
MICALERSQPIDLLPDRSVESVEAWLKEHPSVAVVSRDGSSEYASAIRKGAPQAQQVSDRWHLVKNLAACVSVQITKTLAQLRRAEKQRPARTPAIQQAQQARQAERMTRYEHILELQKHGMKSGEMARALGMSQRTIQRWIATGNIPYTRPRQQRASLIDPYKSYLLKRWQQGCHKGAELERELRARGYKGSQHGVYRYLETLKALPLARSQHKSASRHASSSQLNLLSALSASKAPWLFFRKEEDLKPEEQETLHQLRQASPDLEVTYHLVEAFLHMVRERTGDQLDGWLNKVEASHLQAFQTFVTGVQNDKEAILAGLTLPWSTGPLEGQINRLKLIKRSMYGRAEFDLLKIRVLYQDKKSQERKKKRKNRQDQQTNRLTKPEMEKDGTTSRYTTSLISKVA